MAVVYIHSVGGKIVAIHALWGPMSHSLLLCCALIMTLCRVAVSGFLMISGALLLSNRKNLDFRYVFRHRILRFFYILFFWSAIVYIIKELLNGNSLSLRSFAEKFAEIEISPPYWYLYALIILLFLLPAVTQIAQTKSSYLWSIVVIGVFVTYLPFVLRTLFPEHLYKMFILEIPYVIIPFILGYLLINTQIAKKLRICIYVAGIACAAAAFLLSIPMFDGDQYFGAWWSEKSPFVVGEATAFFIFLQYSGTAERISQSRIITAASRLSLGVYLSHEVIIFLFCKIHPITADNISVSLTVFFYLTCVAAAFLVSLILSKIPYLNRLL